MLWHRKSSLSASEHLVVGAGISGLWAALLLARAGKRVRVIDKHERHEDTDASGSFRGLPTDIALHRLAPTALERPLFREIHRGSPFAFRSNRGVLLFGDRRMAFPPEPLSMMRALGPVTGLSLGAGMVARSARRHALETLERRVCPRVDDADPGFEGFMIECMGERAYRTFCRPYAEKIWGIPPEELSQSVAYRRVRSTRPRPLGKRFRDRAAAWIEGGLRDLDETGFVFPTGGASSILRWLEAELAARSVPIERGRAFRREDVGTTPTLFAGELGDLVESRIEHRGLYLVWLAMPLARACAEQTYHSSDPRHWFGRVTELSAHAAPERRPEETLLCVEIPEGRWGTRADFTRGNQLAALLEQLSMAGIVPQGARAIEAHQRFVPRVYPLLRRGWMGEWRRIMREIAALRSVIPIGPEALFLPSCLDQHAQIAEAAVSHVEARLSIETWIAQAEGST